MWEAEGREEEGFRLLSWAAPGRAVASKQGVEEGEQELQTKMNLVSLRDVGSLAPPHGISHRCQKPSFFVQ